jgi:hypothetical protein
MFIPVAGVHTQRAGRSLRGADVSFGRTERLHLWLGGHPVTAFAVNSRRNATVGGARELASPTAINSQAYGLMITSPTRPIA